MATENCTTVLDQLLDAAFLPPRGCRKRRSRSEVNPRSPMISKLGNDLLVEILIRLPNPRCACRSKVVCKLWRSLISDPCFSRRFLSHHQRMNKPPPPQLLLSDDRESAVLRFLPTPVEEGGYRSLLFAVFDCFKDLLLCGFGEVGDRHTNAELARSYLICNPFTKQWIALPLAPERPVGLTELCARLVCEPLISDSLDLGGGYEYRFRVVCIYQDRNSMKLDVFSSDSGKWKKEALVLQGCRRHRMIDVVSCNGLLYVPYLRTQDKYVGLPKPFITGFNLFRLDIPPTPIDVSPILEKWWWWNISVSQGALHLIVFEDGTKPASSRIVLSVWRLNEASNCWRKVCEGSVKPKGEYRLESILFPTLHPEKPQTVFFALIAGGGRDCRVSCDLRRGGVLEFVARLTQIFTGWRVFQPMASCWPTPIPRYQKLRVTYNGSYNYWVQSNEPIAPSITEEWQGVEQSGNWKKPKVANGSPLLKDRMEVGGRRSVLSLD